METYQPQSARLRDVWTFPVQGRTDPHHATFPNELPRRCILLSTSEAGACQKCGAPRRRTDPDADPDAAREADQAHATLWNIPDAGEAAPPAQAAPDSQPWRAACNCNAPSVPATVLDPFAGTGTTLAVAQRLGRHALGLDLSDSYLRMARANLEKLPLPMGLTGDPP